MTGRRDSEWGSEGERRAAVFESGAPPCRLSSERASVVMTERVFDIDDGHVKKGVRRCGRRREWERGGDEERWDITI